MTGFVQNPEAQTDFPGQPAAAADDALKVPAIAGGAGAALTLIGSFPTWTSVEYQGMSETIGGMNGDGLWTLLLAVLAGGLFAAGLVRRHTMFLVYATVPALLALLIAVLNVADPERLARQDAEDAGLSGDMLDATLEGMDFSSGFGVYVVLLGALAAVAAGGLALVRSRAAR